MKKILILIGLFALTGCSFMNNEDSQVLDVNESVQSEVDSSENEVMEDSASMDNEVDVAEEVQDVVSLDSDSKTEVERLFVFNEKDDATFDVEKYMISGDEYSMYCEGEETIETGDVAYPVAPQFGEKYDRLGQMLTAIACGEDRMKETGFDQSYDGGLRVSLKENNAEIKASLEGLGFACSEDRCEKEDSFMPLDLAPIMQFASEIVGSDCTICG